MSENNVLAEDQRPQPDSHRARHDIEAIIEDQSITIVDAVVTGDLTLEQLASFVDHADPETRTVNPALLHLVEIVGSLLADRRSDEDTADQQVDSIRPMPE